MSASLEATVLPSGRVSAYGPWVALALTVAVVVGGVSLAVDGAETTPDELFDSLATTPYSAPVPENLSLEGPTVDSYSERQDGIDFVGRISFLHVINSPQGSGGALIVDYFVARSSDEANLLLERELREATQANAYWRDSRNHKPPIEATRFRIERFDDIDYPHACLSSEVGAWCHAAVGTVAVYVESRLDLFRLSERPRVQALLRSAVAHVERAT